VKKSAIVTGAGSGVGRAIALALVRSGWRVALLGRHRDSLEETARLSGGAPADVLVHPCDIGRVEEVQAMGRTVAEKLGPVEVLVNAAGTNAPKRALEVLSLEDYHAMIDTNLHGPYYCVQAVLPAMRSRGSGTIVNIISDAGKQASPKSGPAYCMSKFGLAGLNQSINAEERSRGIRACAIFPGDIDTPLLNRRPQPPTPEQRAGMLTADDVAECAMLAINLPARAIAEEILLRPR
jgi:NAD(P)-dependent dehydrogenase (short-subunit alcohol dehydrogenase family)